MNEQELADARAREGLIQEIASQVLAGFSRDPAFWDQEPDAAVATAFEWADAFARRCELREQEKGL